MSDDGVSVTVDGVTVTKRYEAEEFPVPAIAFEFESDREESVAVKVVDDIPKSFPMDCVGFHPDYDSEHWTAYQDHRVQYERSLDVEASLTTVYGIRPEEGADPDEFLGEPELLVSGLGEAAAAGPDDGHEVDDTTMEDIVPSETTGVIRDAVDAGDATVPGLDDPIADPETEPEPEPATTEAGDAASTTGPAGTGGETATDSDDGLASPADDPLADVGVDPIPGSGDDESPAASGADATAVDDAGDANDADELAVGAEPGTGPESGDDADEEPAPTVDAEAVAAALAEGIRNGTVDDDDLGVLRDALGGVPESTESRIEHLQARVSDVEAYGDALSAFIDESGDADGVLAAIEDDVVALHEEAAELESALASADEEREELRSDLDDLSDGVERIDALREDVDDLREDLDDLDEHLATVEDADERIADVRDDVEAVREEVETLQEWRGQLTDVLGG